MNVTEQPQPTLPGLRGKYGNVEQMQYANESENDDAILEVHAFRRDNIHSEVQVTRNEYILSAFKDQQRIWHDHQRHVEENDCKLFFSKIKSLCARNKAADNEPVVEARDNKIHIEKDVGLISKKAMDYYKNMDALISSLEEAEQDVLNGSHTEETLANNEKNDKAISRAAQLSFGINIILTIAKLVASILSGSLAIISSLADSLVDLVSGLVIWYTNRAVSKSSVYSYPFGRSRLEPAAIIIISVVMGLAAVQIIIQSTETIIRQSASPEMWWDSIGMILFTIIAKGILFLYCRRFSNSSIQTLTQDHRNDILSNSFALICGLLGTYIWANLDPIGAIAISGFIFYNWWQTGRDQLQVITGKSAPQEVIYKLIWVSFHHDARIKYIETIRAFHFGSGYLAEVHITLPEEMSLVESHDIGESLQNKLEMLTEIEAAFVHLDHDVSHAPTSEHAILRKNLSTVSNLSQQAV